MIYGSHFNHKGSAPCFNIKTILPVVVIPIIRKRWLWDCLVFIMGIPVLVKQYLAGHSSIYHSFTPSDFHPSTICHIQPLFTHSFILSFILLLDHSTMCNTFKQMVGWSTPSHYLDQCWNIVNLTLRNKLQWNFKQNSYIFIQENAFENVVRNVLVNLSLSQCVKGVLKTTCNKFYWNLNGDTNIFVKAGKFENISQEQTMFIEA